MESDQLAVIGGSCFGVGGFAKISGLVVEAAGGDDDGFVNYAIDDPVFAVDTSGPIVSMPMLELFWFTSPVVGGSGDFFDEIIDLA